MYTSVMESMNSSTEDEKRIDNLLMTANTAKKRARTKIIQLDMIAGFHEKYNSALMDVKIYDQLWVSLTINLNNHGPPEHSSAQWKKVWSEHKYKSKRKRSLSNSTIDQIHRVSDGKTIFIKQFEHPDQSHLKGKTSLLSLSQSSNATSTDDVITYSSAEPTASMTESVYVTYDQLKFVPIFPQDIISLESPQCGSNGDNELPYSDHHSHSNRLPLDEPNKNISVECKSEKDFHTELLKGVDKLMQKDDIIIQQLVETNNLLRAILNKNVSSI